MSCRELPEDGLEHGTLDGEATLEEPKRGRKEGRLPGARGQDRISGGRVDPSPDEGTLKRNSHGHWLEVTKGLDSTWADLQTS
jgi:hypothetical protein